MLSFGLIARWQLFAGRTFHRLKSSGAGFHTVFSRHCIPTHATATSGDPRVDLAGPLGARRIVLVPWGVQGAAGQGQRAGVPALVPTYPSLSPGSQKHPQVVHDMVNSHTLVLLLSTADSRLLMGVVIARVWPLLHAHTVRTHRI
jgi:hypothetical protein